MLRAALRYDLAVIGAGIEGSWTALQALKSGQVGRVALLDQFSLPHARGSSHGQSRIIRHAYTELYHAQIMPEAFREWRSLERDAGRALLTNVPVLCLAADDKGHKAVQAMIDNSRHVLGIDPRLVQDLSASQIKETFPQAKFTDNHRGILDLTGGILHADACLNAVQNKFKSLGGILKDRVKVVALSSSRSGVEIDVESGDKIIADKVAVCAGPWTSKLIDPLLPNNLPINPLRVLVLFWKIKSPHLKVSFKDLTGDYEFWGIPEFEKPGLAKVGHPWPRQTIDPDKKVQGSLADDVKCERKVAQYIRDVLPGLDHSKAVLMQPCIYTMTPDEICILDTVPDKNIVYAAGFSGSGFKKAPVFGQMMLQLLQIADNGHDTSPFRLSRFEPSSKV